MKSFIEAYSAIPNTNADNKNTPVGSDGIRTHAPEETGALNQRLGPLGHATTETKNCFPCFFVWYLSISAKKGLIRDLNPGPLTPKARIIPLDQWTTFHLKRLLIFVQNYFLRFSSSSPKTIHVSTIWRNFPDNDIYLHTVFINNICNITVIT